MLVLLPPPQLSTLKPFNPQPYNLPQPPTLQPPTLQAHPFLNLNPILRTPDCRSQAWYTSPAQPCHPPTCDADTATPDWYPQCEGVGKRLRGCVLGWANGSVIG